MIRLCLVLLRVALVLAVRIAVESIVRAWLAIRPIRQWRTRRKMRSWRAEHPDEVLEPFHDNPKETPVSNDQVEAVVRHVLGFAGGLAAGTGWVTESEAAAIVGALAALAAVAHSIWKKRKAQ